MGISYSPELADTNETSYKSLVISIGTSAVELKVDATRDEDRQVVMVYNDSNTTIYIGPSTVTTSGSTKGTPLVKGQFISLPIGNVAIYAIAGSSSNNVILQELS